MRDGSGLSRRNRTSPREIVALLTALVDDPSFYGSLAVMGVSGTLEEPARAGTPRAASAAARPGRSRDVSALSGYCTTAGGDVLAYSFLMNRTNVVPRTFVAGPDGLRDRSLRIKVS